MSDIEKLIDAARQRMGSTTQERLDAARQRTIDFNNSLIEQYRCPVCKVDTIHYSHTFDCKFRGM